MTAKSYQLLVERDDVLEWLLQSTAQCTRNKLNLSLTTSVQLAGQVQLGVGGLKGSRLKVHRELLTRMSFACKLCLLLPFIANVPVFQKQDPLKQLLQATLPLQNARLAPTLIADHMPL